ncbi:MAG: DNA polymerase III subunit delta' C-terminal domain-containing protein [Gammaproteobacteria bacterium]|jgi:DNA polymerase-3 subunit delta'|nr:DNA polymerase III subunit delta' C-terminal domain-containing protein [Gammaproteobacteria bacterium]MDP6732319.1 DNA polymerase III subunit delta' C-terminal domain-containing protein [Gammaproteobacteria bacterium]
MIKDSNMLPEVPLPWQNSQWQRLAQQYEERLLPHAFLVCGDQGLGKSLFVRGFSRYMLCQDPLKQFACGICRNCRQAGEDFSHPDVLHIAPLEGKRDINVEQIQSLTDFIVHTSHAGTAKIVIIDVAHHLNISSANALLKTLEEPTLNSYLFLVTEYPGSLPATIRSRCHRVLFSSPAREDAQQWLNSKSMLEGVVDMDRLLEAAECRPLYAIQLAEQGAVEQRDQFLNKLYQLSTGSQSPQSLVSLASKIGESAVVGHLLLTSSILIKSLSSNQRPGESTNEIDNLYSLLIARERPIHSLLIELMQFYDAVIAARKQMLSGSNPNTQLIIESLIWRWYQFI